MRRCRSGQTLKRGLYGIGLGPIGLVPTGVQTNVFWLMPNAQKSKIFGMLKTFLGFKQTLGKNRGVAIATQLMKFLLSALLYRLKTTIKYIVEYIF